MQFMGRLMYQPAFSKVPIIVLYGLKNKGTRTMANGRKDGWKERRKDGRQAGVKEAKRKNNARMEGMSEGMKEGICVTE